MQERTNAYMTVPKTKVYLYHLYLAFSSAKILTVFQKLSLKIIKQTQMQKTHTIPFVCFTFSFQILFNSFFFSKPLRQDTFLKHKRNPCTVNNLQLCFFFWRHLQCLIHISPSERVAAQHPQDSKAFERVSWHHHICDISTLLNVMTSQQF